MTRPDPADLAAVFAGEVLVGEEWRDHDFTGKRVAVISRGNDAVRLLPEVAWTARSVKIFLDDPDWVLPAMPTPFGVAVRAASYVPVAGPRARRLIARTHLRFAVKDPWVRRLLTPDDRFGAHSTGRGDCFYDVLQRSHCKLIRWPVYGVTAEGVRSAEGIEHQVDAIVIPAPERLRRIAVPLHQTGPTGTREDRSA
ncbi:FAD-dependent oxidoreductase [Nocardioides humilatus]|uniref:FAD-dependent oxidoreductase n=1 Tax=Nocardioides humilatus TaxID=2607660 RepID=UPI00165F9EE9|nr:FAD-dependent oxidoreductase [Nocardioides humilatus]